MELFVLLLFSVTFFAALGGFFDVFVQPAAGEKCLFQVKFCQSFKC